MLYAFLHPRPLHALAKQELWDHKFMAYLMNMWKSIPVDRQNMGRSTMDACFKVLDDQHILAIAPEGTRSKDGKLQEGKGGVAFIAHKKDIPMIPVAVMGFTSFPEHQASEANRDNDKSGRCLRLSKREDASMPMHAKLLPMR